MTEVLAIVPARGGSKAMPRKNLCPLLGRPLIAWALDVARAARLVSRTIVSTDDEEIAEVARGLGAEVPFLRPSELARDLSTDVEFLLHALDWLRDHEGYTPEVVVRVPPTSPLSTGAYLDEGIRTLLETPGADAVRPIVEASKHPYKMWRISTDGRWLEPFLPPSVTGFEAPQDLPRQVYPKAYIHTGAMDVIWVRTLRTYRTKTGVRLGYFFMRPEDAVNIDDEVDLALAEVLLRTRHPEGGGLHDE